MVLLSKCARITETGEIIVKCPSCRTESELLQGTFLRLRPRTTLTPSMRDGRDGGA